MLEQKSQRFIYEDSNVYSDKLKEQAPIIKTSFVPI